MRKDEMADIRVGYFANLEAWGGAEVYIEQVIRGAAEIYPHITVFCRGQNPYIIARIYRALPQGCNVVMLDKRISDSASECSTSDLSLTRRIWRKLTPMKIRTVIYCTRIAYKEVQYCRRMFQKHPVDLIHFNLFSGYEPAVIAAKLERIPVIIGTYHSTTRYINRMLISRVIRRLCTRSFTKVITVSQEVKRGWLREGGHSAQKMQVIYNGINVSAFDHDGDRNGLRRELGLDRNISVVGVTARLEPKKGHKYLVEAALIVKRNIPSVVFILVGDGSQREELEERVREMNLSKNFRFLGFRENVIPITQIYDLAVLPSTCESLGYALIEGLACGKPAIGPNAGGVPEVIVDGKTGYLVEPENSEALAQAMIELLTNHEKAEQMGRAGRRRVERLFQADRMVKETLALYDQLVKIRAEDLEWSH